VGLTLLGAGTARFTGVGRVPPPSALVEVSRDVRFEDRIDGAVVVREAGTQQIVSILAPGRDNFVRGVLRGFARDRRSRELGSEDPFRLTRWSDGRLSLTDLATQRVVELEAFGATNTGAFARLLTTEAGQ